MQDLPPAALILPPVRINNELTRARLPGYVSPERWPSG